MIVARMNFRCTDGTILNFLIDFWKQKWNVNEKFPVQNQYGPTYSFFSNGWFERIFFIELSRRRWGISLSIVFDLFTRRETVNVYQQTFEFFITISCTWIVVWLVLFSLKKKKEKKSLLKKEVLSRRFVDLPLDLNHHHHRSISVGR